MILASSSSSTASEIGDESSRSISYEVMAAAHHARLGRRHPPPRRDGLGRDPVGSEKRHQRRALRIVSDQSNQDWRAPERGDIACDVAGAPGHKLVPPMPQDRNRRLWRYAIDVAADEYVQHRLAENSDRRFRMVEQHRGPRSEDTASVTNTLRCGAREAVVSTNCRLCLIEEPPQLRQVRSQPSRPRRVSGSKPRSSLARGATID